MSSSSVYERLLIIMSGFPFPLKKHCYFSDCKYRYIQKLTGSSKQCLFIIQIEICRYFVFAQTMKLPEAVFDRRAVKVILHSIDVPNWQKWRIRKTARTKPQNIYGLSVYVCAEYNFVQWTFSKTELWLKSSFEGIWYFENFKFDRVLEALENKSLYKHTPWNFNGFSMSKLYMSKHRHFSPIILYFSLEMCPYSHF
jgi:hypothetical protein